MATATTYLLDKENDHLTGKTAFTMPTMYVGVFTAAPTMPAGTGGTEPSSSVYTRVEATGNFAASSGGDVTTNVQINFAEAAGTVGTPVWVGLWDSATPGTGHLLAAGVLTDPPSSAVEAGDTMTIAAGDLTLTRS